MITRSERLTSLTDVELSQQRLALVVRLMEKLKREIEELRAQIYLLNTSNKELSEYARVFHLDEAKEEENIKEAASSALESIVGQEALGDLDSAETFMGSDGSGLVDDF